MKILLAIFCGLMILFAGGCALVLVAEGTYPSGGGMMPLALVPGGIVALNVLVLVAMFGTKRPKLWAFYVLAALDAVVVLLTLVLWVTNEFRDSGLNMLAALVAAGFAAKAVLTLMTAKSLASRPAAEDDGP